MFVPKGNAMMRCIDCNNLLSMQFYYPLCRAQVQLESHHVNKIF